MKERDREYREESKDFPTCCELRVDTAPPKRLFGQQMVLNGRNKDNHHFPPMDTLEN